MSTDIWRTAAAVLIAVGCAGPAAAQQEEVTWNFPGWSFTPGVSLAGVYDSNIGLADAPASTQSTESDQVFVIQPFGRLEYTSPRTRLSTGYRGNIRRYMNVEQLNGFDYRADVSLRRIATKRLTFFLSDSYSDVPTTDDVELNGVPFSRTGTQTNSFSGGIEARLAKFTDLSAQYDHNWVAFDRSEQTFLSGGVVNGVRTDVRQRVSERLSLGGEYSFRMADLKQGARELTFHDAGGVLRYTAGAHTTLNASAGVSHLNDKAFNVSRTGPYVRLGVTHEVVRATVGASFERNFIPSFGLGGTTQSQELRGYVRMPINRSRFYVQGSAAWRKSEPLIETELELDTIWVRSTVGYSATRWLRLEGFHAYNRQDSIVTGGEIDRHRAGVQVVMSQPMRIR